MIKRDAKKVEEKILDLPCVKVLKSFKELNIRDKCLAMESVEQLLSSMRLITLTESILGKEEAHKVFDEAVEDALGEVSEVTKEVEKKEIVQGSKVKVKEEVFKQIEDDLFTDLPVGLKEEDVGTVVSVEEGDEGVSVLVEFSRDVGGWGIGHRFWYLGIEEVELI